jgi:Na+/H+ antiporter NhaD/arsenite permease-like protein
VEAGHLQINPWMLLPFVVLLTAIALAPLLSANWWNRHYPKVAFVLGAITLTYYGYGLGAYGKMGETGMEYLSFIALIGSLFVVSGGIHIQVKGEATPRENVIFLLVGAIIANVLGTTGASMLLIRPWLRMNKFRVTAHHVVFFIFIVSNVGGCLTPIGDPPLFLGYLQGIPFWWVFEHCWPMWAVGVGLLLAMFYYVDRRNYQRAPAAVRAQLAEPPDQFRVQGASNLFYLAIILLAVFINHPRFLREALMVSAALASHATTSKSILRANDFNFHPIKEVAILFAGIFATMMPALDWLQANAGQLHHPSAAAFYWAAGSLSSVLDNAPTYLSFLSAAFGAFIDPATISQIQAGLQTGPPNFYDHVTGPLAESIRWTCLALQKYHAAALASGHVTASEIETAYLLGNTSLNQFIVAISVGSVFFGANTYIGNGPNFMVKAIADQQQVHHVPSFLGYIGKFTLPFMLPTLLVVWFLFFQH